MNAPRDDSDTLGDELEAARLRIAEVEAELQRLRVELAQSTASSSARITQAAVRGVRRLVPPGTRRQQSLHTAASRTATLLDQGPAALAARIRRERALRRAVGVADTAAARRAQYRRWLALHTPSPDDLRRMRDDADARVDAPVFSLVMPVHDPQREWLDVAIHSVLDQAYAHLELCIADDASTRPHVRSVLERAAADPRVRVVHREARGGIAVASNSALELATGEFVGFIDHDDVLRPHALYAMAAYCREHPDSDLVYSDEDKLLPDGGVGLPTFKPDYSPDRLLAENYINHFTVMRRSVVSDLGGFREGYDGSQDHDLVLRVAERARHVGHVADVLYGWRMVAGSTAVSADYKPLAREAGRRAVDDALRRRGIEARVDIGPSPGLYIPRYAIAGEPPVDVFIVSGRSGRGADECRASVEEQSTYRNRRVFVVPPDVHTPAAINRAIHESSAEHVVVLDESIRVLTPRWIETMLELSQRDDIGAVGLRLRFADGAVAHEGMVLGRIGIAAAVDQHLPVIKEMGAVSGACLMTRRAVFEKAGGLDERFHRELFDVDYCMRVRELGRRVLCTPLAELTCGPLALSSDADGALDDTTAFAASWGTAGPIEDPYLNRNVFWPNPLSLRID